MGKGSRSKGHYKGGSKGGNKGGKHNRQREFQWEKEKEWDRRLFPRNKGETDIWDRIPTFKIIDELEDDRSVERLEEILTKAEEKLSDLREKLSDSRLIEEEKQKVENDFKKKISDIEEEKNQKKEALNQLDEELNKKKEIHQQIRNKIKAIHDEKDAIKKKKQEKFKDNNITPNKLPTEEETKLRIKELERDLETRPNLSRNMEKQMVLEIKKLENLKYISRDIYKCDSQLKAKDEEILLCKQGIADQQNEREIINEKKENIKHEMSMLSKSIAQIKREMLAAAQEDLHSLEKRQAEFVDLMTHKVGYRAAKTKYEEALEYWIVEKDEYLEKRREEEKILNARNAKRQEEQEKREQIMSRKRENPWVGEKAVCSELIQYLETIVPKSTKPSENLTKKDSTQAETNNTNEDTNKNDEADNSANNNNNNSASKANGMEAPEGAMIIHDADTEKKSDEEWLFGDLSKDKPKSKPPEAKKQDDLKIKHSLQYLKHFDTLKVQIPTTKKEAATILEQLRGRAEWFKTAAYDDFMPDLRPGASQSADRYDDNHHEGNFRSSYSKGKRGKGKGKGRKGGSKGRKGYSHDDHYEGNAESSTVPQPAENE